MTAPTAPTPAFILSAGFDLLISCNGRCNALRLKPDLALALCTAGKGAIPVDQLKFRCEVCGVLGEPFVLAHYGQGDDRDNRIWPVRKPT